MGQTPNDVFKVINNPRKWWSEEIEGNTDKLNNVFNYHFEDIHRCQIKIIEYIPNKKVVWHVMENYFKPGIFEEYPHRTPDNDKIPKNQTEWTDTKIIFVIFEKGDKTQLRFTHQGLTSVYECYHVCSNSWNHYIGQSLFGLLTSGKGQPNSVNTPITKDEEKFHFANGKF